MKESIEPDNDVVRATFPTSRDSNAQRSKEYRPFSSFLTDTYSRQHNYLRISVTERCNLRCVYCMPEEGVRLTPDARNLTTPEIIYLARLFAKQGVTKIRLTGGEPTVRKDFVNLVQQLGQLRPLGLQELCLTTNGISLYRKLPDLVAAGVTGINLSLDTLDPFQFTLLTRRNGHDAVLRSMRHILAMNASGQASIALKLNCVVLRGINDREILDFVGLAQDNDMEIRFIEYMPFDRNKWSAGKMVSFAETLDVIRRKHPGITKARDRPSDTSKTYTIPGFAGRVGFITSMTENFCAGCNRLRITSDGNLKVCLFGNSEVSLRDALRECNGGRPIDADAMQGIMSRQHSPRSYPTHPGDEVADPEQRLLRLVGMAVKGKEEKHAELGQLENMENRPMILIGG